MPESDQYSSSRELLKSLMAKVEEDTYPSSTVLDTIESLLRPDDVPSYAEALMARIRQDRYPSISLIHRVQRLA